MGATSADTQREIEEIRKDITSATAELQKRVRRVADVRAQSQRAKDNPAALAGIGLAVVGIGGLAAARAVVNARRRRRPQERLRRTVMGAAESLSEQFERARGAIPLDVRFGSRDDDDDDNRGRGPQIQLKEPSMIKKMLWGALVAAMVAGGGLLSRRLSAAVWRAAMKEDPPTASI